MVVPRGSLNIVQGVLVLYHFIKLSRVHYEETYITEELSTGFDIIHLIAQLCQICLHPGPQSLPFDNPNLRNHVSANGNPAEPRHEERRVC